MMNQTQSQTHRAFNGDKEDRGIQVFCRISNCILCYCFKLRGVIENFKNVCPWYLNVPVSVALSLSFVDLACFATNVLFAVRSTFDNFTKLG